MSYRKFILPLILLLFALFAVAPLSAKSKFPLTVKALLSTSYDDNILKYSARDLGRFESNTEPFPSDLTTTDDWINTFGVRLYRDFDLGRSFKFRPYYSGRISLYAVNAVKNTQSHSFLGRLAYRGRLHLSLKYFYLPSYYLRNYRDRDLNEYHAAQFDQSRPSASLRLRLPPYEIEAEYGREFTYYNTYFTEYDVEAYFWDFTGSYTALHDLTISLDYLFKVSENVGFNQPDEGELINPTEDTESGDASYEEDQFGLSLIYDLPLESNWIWNVGLGLRRSWRYYQSSQPFMQDPFHAGRKDRRDMIEPFIGFSPQSNVELEFRFTYDLRRTDSPDPAVSSTKNFDNRSFEVTLVYQLF